VRTVELNLARALLRYFTWRIAVEAKTKKRRYAIGKANIRYSDIERRDEMPFVDNAVKPPCIRISFEWNTKDCY
jgi:hypothetical protein